MKTTRLCAQVEEAIAYALGAAANPILRELHVVGVDSLRGVAQLRVRLRADGDLSIEVISDALERAGGYLRGEVATAINRKRVPTLTFAVVPRELDAGDG